MRRRTRGASGGLMPGVVLFLLWGYMLGSLATAQMIKATLSKLVESSRVIVLGHIHEETHQRPSEGVVYFDVEETIKGEVRNPLSLCNYHPDSEWPDLSRLKGDYVILRHWVYATSSRLTPHVRVGWE